MKHDFGSFDLSRERTDQRDKQGHLIGGPQHGLQPTAADVIMTRRPKPGVGPTNVEAERVA